MLFDNNFLCRYWRGCRKYCRDTKNRSCSTYTCPGILYKCTKYHGRWDHQCVMQCILCNGGYVHRWRYGGRYGVEVAGEERVIVGVDDRRLVDVRPRGVAWCRIGVAWSLPVEDDWGGDRQGWRSGGTGQLPTMSPTKALFCSQIFFKLKPLKSRD